jgi:hypothetical protein
MNNKIEDRKRRAMTKEAFYQKMHDYHWEQRKIAKQRENSLKEKEDSKLISHGIVLDDTDLKCLIN